MASVAYRAKVEERYQGVALTQALEDYCRTTTERDTRYVFRCKLYRFIPVWSRFTQILKQVLQCKLYLPIFMHRGRYGAECGVAKTLVGQTKLRVVEDVEKLGAKL